MQEWVKDARQDAQAPVHRAGKTMQAPADGDTEIQRKRILVGDSGSERKHSGRPPRPFELAAVEARLAGAGCSGG